MICPSRFSEELLKTHFVNTRCSLHQTRNAATGNATKLIGLNSRINNTRSSLARVPSFSFIRKAARGQSGSSKCGRWRGCCSASQLNSNSNSRFARWSYSGGKSARCRRCSGQASASQSTVLYLRKTNLTSWSSLSLILE